MISLQNSQRFKEEVETYERVLSEISNESLKKEGTALLNRLKGEVKSIDVGHDELRSKSILPEMVTDSKNKIIEIRKRLTSIVNDWEKVKKSKKD